MKIRVRRIQAGGPGFTYSGQGMTAATIEFIYGTSSRLYGFAGFEPKRLDNSGTTIIKSFGNKSKYIFDTTEDRVITEKRGIGFENTPEFYRDYIISRADWGNPNYAFELEAFHHLKYKRVGPNEHCDKVRKDFDLRQLVTLNKAIPIWKRQTNVDKFQCASGVKAEIIE